MKKLLLVILFYFFRFQILLKFEMIFVLFLKKENFVIWCMKNFSNYINQNMRKLCRRILIRDIVTIYEDVR